MPLVSRTFDQLIDFTRTSAATYVDATGKIVPTAASRNLLTFTQEFDNAGWTKTAATVYPFDPATASYGPELVTNGNFSGGTTGWTLGDWVISSGQASATATSTSLYGGQFTPVAGRVYRVEFDIISYASGTLSVTVGGNFTTNVNLTGAAAAPGRKSVFVTAGSTPARALEFYGGSVTATIDNISVKELSGGLIAAPDGTLTADTLVATAGASTHNVSQAVSTSGSLVTFSIYAKAGTHSFIQLLHTNVNSVNFNLSTGTVGTVPSGMTASMTAVGNGFYRCTVSQTPLSAGSIRVAMVSSISAAFNESWTAAGTETVFLWGAQLEQASTATDYTRNNGGVYPPRFDYDPVTLAPKGLLVEEQRTNLLTYSEQFDNAVWARQNATANANAAVAPDGTLTADKLIDSTANLPHYATRSMTLTAGIYTFSAYLKQAELSSANLWFNDTIQGVAYFNLSSGTVSVTAGSIVDTATITNVGNGWYRCTITTKNLGAGTYFPVIGMGNPASYTGDGTSGLYIWGAQLEAGAFATSYIPTVASQVTRTADVATITGANFSQWYNQSEGTFVAEFTPYVSGNYTVAAATDGSFNNRIQIIAASTAQFLVGAGGAGSIQALIDAGTINAGAVNKVAGAYRVNDFAASTNNSAAVADTSGTVPTVSRLDVGNLANGAEPVNGWLRSIRFFPTRLSNAQLQALTA